MNILTKTFSAPPVDVREIARYAGCRTENHDIEEKIRACVTEAQHLFKYTIVYTECPVAVTGTTVDFGVFRVPSQSLCRALAGCCTAVLFAATVGLEIDRLVARYGITEPSKALLLQSFGAERIEALCDRFGEFLKETTGKTLHPRFSPGYGDCPLCVQHDLFTVLDCSRKIGLSLTDTLLMSPTKSVTAVIGLEG
ncbi:MAG: Vitamin B12 dependent methionine synthase activation subunit [Clostridia bacterium]|nr:Vitamin B12 dependent methionine synthase activation subunit [Clostridia bacterium]